ncbi:MAG: hypothetical protein Q9191_000238, partial [Dirinaria sp. TL-2023a]
TRDIVSVIVTQYNDTAITSTKFMSHGFPFNVEDGGLPTTFTVPHDVISIMEQDYHFAEPYADVGNFLLVNLTDGQVDAATSIPYPSAYMAAGTIGYWAVNGPCSQCSSYQNIFDPFVDSVFTASNQCVYTTLSISLTDGYYERLPIPAFKTPEGYGELSDTESAAAWLRTNSYLHSLEPNIGGCAVLSNLEGPPLVKIPVSALTGTVTTTVRGLGLAPPQTAAPASPITTSMVLATSTSSSQHNIPTSSSQLPGSKSSTQLRVQTREPKSSESPSTTKSKVNPAPKLPNAPKHQSEPEQVPKPQVTNTETRISPVPGPNIVQETTEQANSDGLKPAISAVPRPALPFAGTLFSQDVNSRIVLPEGTSTPGGALTVSSTSISLAPGGSYVTIGTSIQQLAFVTPPASTRISAIVTAQTIYTTDSDGNYLVNNQVLTKGGLVSVSDIPISLALDGGYAVIGTTTQDLVVPKSLSDASGGTAAIAGSASRSNFATAAGKFTFGGATYTANSVGEFIIAGQTLSPGEVLTLSGTPISYAANRDAFVVGSSTQLLSSAERQNVPIITLEGSQYTANSEGNFVIASQTLTAGGKIILSDTPISYDAARGGDIVIDSSTQYLAQPVKSGFIVYASSTHIEDSIGDFVIASQTLKSGGVITVSGTPISYGTVSDGDIVIGSSTQYIAQPVKSGFIVYAGSTYKEDSVGDFVIASQTLTPGGVITVSGTPISYASEKTDVVLGTSTEATETELGGYIISAFGNDPRKPTNTASATEAAFTGAARKSREERSLWFVWMANLIAIAAVLLG